MKKIILAVTNDLVSDQRVHKVAMSLLEMGYSVKLVGRVLSKSLPITERKYSTKRFSLPFIKGPGFYTCYNVRLFFFLLFSRFNVVVANDLDTLPACFLAAKIRYKKLVYDSHEYFTEVPELIHRKNVQRIWLKIEKFILPKIKHSYTVCESIANIYKKKYGIDMKVVRNIPEKNYNLQTNNSDLKPTLKKVIIYQGALNKGRGIESVIEAMQYIENTIFWIIGDGDIREELKKLVFKYNVSEKVLFVGKVPFESLQRYTKQAHLGISLEEPESLNYYYALPNKLFDYLHAGVPVLVSDLPEMKKIVEQYKPGEICKSREPQKLAVQIQRMLTDETLREHWQKNIEIAKQELTWENEKKVLLEVYGA